MQVSRLFRRVSFLCALPLIIQRENDEGGKKRKDRPRKKLLASPTYDIIPHLSVRENVA